MPNRPRVQQRRTIPAQLRRSAAAAAVRAGATVVAPVRSEKSAQKLKDTVVSGDLERLKIKIADVSDVQQAKKLAQEVKQEHGPLNHVVSAIGAWWQKGAARPTLLSSTPAALRRMSSAYCTSNAGVA